MKSTLPKSLVVICLLGLARCASVPKSKSAILSPLEDRLMALEMDLKEQSKEITRLNALINQLNVKSSTETAPLTEGALIQKPPIKSNSTKVVMPRSLSVIKIQPKQSEESVAVSPLMEDVETIADSSQDSMHSYYRGVQLYNDKHYEEAIDFFKSFVTENPNHVYADRAQFLMADSHFKNKDYSMVIVATHLLESKYPYSLKLPEAAYQRGIAFIEMNQIAQAKLTLSNLIKNFPKDPIVGAARKKWVELSKDSSTRVQ